MEERREVYDYFIEHTTAKFNRLDERFDKIDVKLDQLISFRWMLIGMATTVSAVVSVVIAIYFGR